SFKFLSPVQTTTEIYLHFVLTFCQFHVFPRSKTVFPRKIILLCENCIYHSHLKIKSEMTSTQLGRNNLRVIIVYDDKFSVQYRQFYKFFLFSVILLYILSLLRFSVIMTQKRA
ncbi:hypothetical protein L9F63_002768, partial [Diploptera punctata]